MNASFFYVIVCVWCLGTAGAQADGYPYNSSTQEVFVDTVRIRLSAAQQLELAKSGSLKPDEAQRTFLLTLYPNLPEQIHVLSATYNDSVEGMDEGLVNCFWVAPAEVALTLPPRAEKKVWKFAMPPEGMKPPHLRLGADGVIYESGKELSLAAAMKLIETTPTLDGDAGGERLVEITLPPHYRVDPEDSEHENALANRKVAEIFARLESHSRMHKVVLQQTW